MGSCRSSFCTHHLFVKDVTNAKDHIQRAEHCTHFFQNGNTTFHAADSSVLRALQHKHADDVGQFHKSGDYTAEDKEDPEKSPTSQKPMHE